MDYKQKVNDKITKDYKSFLKMAKNIVKTGEYQDILHECLVEILEFDEDKLKDIFPYFEFYLIQMIKYSFRSKTSKYQQKYKKTNLILDTNNYGFENKLLFIPENINYLDKNELNNINLFDDSDSEDIKTEKINEINKILVEKCTWYQRSVFLYKIENNLTFKKFEAVTKIPASSVFNTYKETLSIIRNNLKNKYT